MAAVSFYLFEETRPPESCVTEKGCIIVHIISNNIILTRNPAESSLPVVQLSAGQERAAWQSLKVYCQPIEYYNILHDRALDKLWKIILVQFARLNVQVLSSEMSPESVV
ncbi:hypothetical protein CTI12_AA277670 [Artemisia annua]|uniref:Uncharacterized protein n=1 Tax=Artemisia annua TaxID=35608 RepID=A0A2U1NDX9_ARTAN|nr:hypothetical protein CTI12_AA277670 [Artemisia annua]